MNMIFSGPHILYLQNFKGLPLQVIVNGPIVYINISSIHFNLNFAHQFTISVLSGAKMNQHQESHQRQTTKIKSQFLQHCEG